MNSGDQQAIEALFDRLAETERQAGPRDSEAEAFIRGEIARQPGAPYYMAQTIVAQQQALETAQKRIEELEGGRLPSRAGERRGGARVAQPWGGGGFLAGAAQTAMGVAGGVLLGNLLAGALFGDRAEAQEQPAEPANEPADADVGDAGGDFDAGGFDF